MTLRTIACDPPHPLLHSGEGGVVDQLRVVHDVFRPRGARAWVPTCRAEFGTWLQCRTPFSPAARGAAFCELLGAVTTCVVTADTPALRADLPPAALVATCRLMADVADPHSH